MKLFTSFVAFSFCTFELVAGLGGQPVISFNNGAGSVRLAGSGVHPVIVVNKGDLWGVTRAASDLASDFGRVTGSNATFIQVTGSAIPANSSGPLVIVGTIGQSKIITNLIKTGKLNVTAVRGKWEAYQTQLVLDPAPGISSALVIAGADKRGSIYGIYDVSQQIGVSPWYFWADVPVPRQTDIFALAGRKVQGSPSVKYRGIFLNDEAPALTNWVQQNFPPGVYGPGYNHDFYELVFELLLRLRANYLWPAEWNSMFYVDDKMDGPVANRWGIVIGTSHTEPLARATKEQSVFLNGVWSWSSNQENMTDFLRDGVTRARNWETLWTMGMRGLGDTASPTLTAGQLEEIIQVEQQLLQQGLNTTNLDNVPQMWCIYKEVGGYYEQGLAVPDDITILWADDNWGNPERLPIGNETTRLAGSGIYYHFDYVGNPRDYKWINTINLAYTHEKLIQTYERSARQIWIFNVGDLKPLEIPINFAMDLAYDVELWHAPDATQSWLETWATNNYGATHAPQIAEIMMNYSMFAARRKYELMDINFYSIVNYNEADTVLQEWSDLVIAAQAVYNALPTAAQPSFFEMILHPSLAGQTVYQIYLNAAKQNLYAEQGRTSANAYMQDVFGYSATDASLTDQYNSLLDGKWNHMMDQTHLGYENYWQQPMRNSLPAMSYVQTQLNSLTGLMGVTCEGNNGTIPGDDQYHGNGGGSLVLPPMDPYMSTPTHWIDIFSRGNTPFDYLVNISVPYVTATPPSGTLQASGRPNATDIRVHLSVDWAAAPVGSSQVTIHVQTTSGGIYPFHQQHQYGPQYGVPIITLTLNNTQVPPSFCGFVESDATISIEPQHFSTNASSPDATAYYAIIPGYGRTLSGVTLLPATAPLQDPTSSLAPKLRYDFYTFTPLANASVIVSIGPTLNTDPNIPVAYAVAIDNFPPETIQPIPVTVLGSYGAAWTQMVSNFSTWNSTLFSDVAAGSHTLDLWALTPGITFQKVVIDLGGMRASYLGPPEGVRV